ncbi:MAG: AMP-binding protein [Salinibacterium sp.]|nr:AMP-binding protein [Salinibacterium sp.]MBF0672332.1 AMP-binding protein [Salinibacterium sp.]
MHSGAGERQLAAVDGGDWRAVDAAVRERFDSDGPALYLGTGEHPESVGASTAVVIETSGSTGIPKRVVLSEAALRASADATAHALGGTGQWLLCLPAHYVAGLQVLVRSHLAGLPVEWVEPGFDAEAFAAASARLTEERRYVSLVPAQLARLVEAGEQSEGVRAAVARFDALLTGGQAMPTALADRARALGYTVVRSYGSSETATGCIYDGYPVGATRTRLVDGVLEIASPTLADGYLDAPGLTDAAFRVEGGTRWYRTGDRARIHADGRVEVLGRADNVIVSGGINVSLDRVEAAVREVPGFEGAVAVGVPSEKWGHVPVVVVDGALTGALADDQGAEDVLASIRRLVRESIGVAAQPERIVAIERMPLLASGKPDRRAVTRLVASGD